MKLRILIIFSCFLFMSIIANAQTEVSVNSYQNEIQDLMNQYGEKFDDCFPTLSSDFPSLPDEYLEIDEHIDQLSDFKWYHRKIPFVNTEIDEIVISIKHDISHYLIRVSYLYNEQEGNFMIYGVNFMDNVGGSVEGEFWNGFTIPSAISAESLKEIDACMGTPGFMIIIFLIALAVVFINYIKKNKVRK